MRPAPTTTPSSYRTASWPAATPKTGRSSSSRKPRSFTSTSASTDSDLGSGASRRPCDRDVESPVRVDRRAREGITRADDDSVGPGVGAQRIERLRRGDAEPAPLSRRELPVAGVTSDFRSVLVDNGAGCALEALPGEEVAVVVAREEARLLTLRLARSREAGARGFGARLVLRLLAEWEANAVELRAGSRRASMYDWSLSSTARASSRRPRCSTMRA